MRSFEASLGNLGASATPTARYLALLADSRRLNALLAELSAVQGLADSAAPEEACHES